jgi:hypothetical protein
MKTPDIKIVRITGMYGDCKAVQIYRDRERIGDSYLSVGEPGGALWYISACGIETTLRYDLNKSIEENLAAVELTLRLQVSAADALASPRAT